MTYKIGQKVKCNGFDGTITEVCTGQLTGMLVVRLPGQATVPVGRDTPAPIDNAPSKELGQI